MLGQLVLVGPYAVPLLATAPAIFILGGVIVVLERGSLVSLAFGALTLAVAIGLVARAATYTVLDPSAAMPWARAAYAGVTFVPPAVYLFSVVVLGTYAQRARVVGLSWLLAIGFAIVAAGTNVLFDELYRYDWGFYPRYRWPIIPYLALFAIFGLLTFREYWLTLRHTSPATIHYRRARAFALTLGLGYLAGVDFLPGFGIAVYPFGYVLVLAFLAASAWTIWRYRLIDITPAFAARQIIQTMTDALLVTDAEGIIHLVNPAATRLFERSADELVGRSAHALLGSLVLGASGSMPAGIENLEITYPSKPGEARTLSLSTSAMRDRAGQTVAVVCVARDVTQRVRQEGQIRQQAQELQTAYETLERTQAQVIRQERLYALGTMASGIVHNFNNSLTPIIGYTQLLLLRPRFQEDRATLERYLRLIHAAGKDAARVLARLSDFYRPTRGDTPPAVDPNEAIRDTVELTRPRWHDQASLTGKRIQVVTDLATVPTVAGNPAELREVLINLVFNAVDAIANEGTIAIRTRAAGPNVALEVSDTGVGMTDEARLRCFDPFFTTKGDGGTGLGLSTAYGIVRRNGGAIDVASAVGRGTTFTITLPVHAGTPTVPATPLPGTPSRRVLLIDDDDSVREVVRLYLSSDGHRVEAVADVGAAIERLQANPFDLVIVDQSVVATGGVRLPLLVKEWSAATPVLMLTGFANLLGSDDERPAGVDLILSKPVTLETLRAAVTQLSTASADELTRQ